MASAAIGLARFFGGRGSARSGSRGGKYAVTYLEGEQELYKALAGMVDDVLGENLRSAVEEGAEIVRETAAQLAPQSDEGHPPSKQHPGGLPPGHLSRSIVRRTLFTRRQSKAEVRVGMTADAYYGRFQELGTQYHPAQPFLRPALDHTKDEVVAEVRERLHASITSGLRRR